MKIITLDQRSPEWLDWRFQGIGASEMAQVLNVSPFGSAQKLWEFKTKRRPGEKLNPAMLKGQQDEPLALAAYEELTGEIMIPLCAEHDTLPYIRASFDGIRPSDYKKALEIKCPGSKTHQMAINGQVPEYYLVQMHQQMLVADLQEIDYFSYFKEWPDASKRGVLITVKRSDLMIQKILEEGEKFWNAVLADTPLYAEGWAEAAAYWLKISEEVDALKEMEEQAKEALIKLSAGKSMQGNGVSLTVSEKTGAIDYKAFISDKGVDTSDLESFRKASSISTVIRKMKSSTKVEEKPAEAANKSTLVLTNAPAEGQDSWGW